MISQNLLQEPWEREEEYNLERKGGTFLGDVMGPSLEGQFVTILDETQV